VAGGGGGGGGKKTENEGRGRALGIRGVNDYSRSQANFVGGGNNKGSWIGGICPSAQEVNRKAWGFPLGEKVEPIEGASSFTRKRPKSG